MTRILTTAAALALLAGAASAENMIDATGVAIDGATATFPMVSIDEDGYLVIHATLDGAPVAPASIGHVAIPAGDNENVAVTIDYPFVAGESYVAMLHNETNDNDTYDFGEGSTDVDVPVMADGAPVTQAFQGE